MSRDSRVEAWLRALDERHLSDLLPSEVARALRALSSCYVERRSKLAEGAALESAGKRAAFALFYGPVHLFVTRQILAALPGAAARVDDIVDLGCGTATAGAAWALHAESRRILGMDRHPWAVAEANWTYRTLNLQGRAIQRNLGNVRLRAGGGSGIVLAYVLSELPESTRRDVRAQVMAAADRGASVLIVEPIARTVSRWWDEWTRDFEAAGGRSDEWRFPADLPERQRGLARAAGLDLRELTARTLFLPGGPRRIGGTGATATAARRTARRRGPSRQ